MTARQQRIAAVLGVALFVSYAYFYPAGGWNQNSRFAMIRAILERHTLQIDAYQLHTGDRAFWRGHYYTDKAPGASLLALAPVQAARFVSRAAGVDPASFPGIAWTSYVAAVVTSGIFTVIAALCVFWLSLRWGATTGAALFAATRLRPEHAGVGLRHAVHGTRPDRRVPDDRARRRRRASANVRSVCACTSGLDSWSRGRLGGRHRIPGGDPGRSSSGCWRSLRERQADGARRRAGHHAHRGRRRDRGGAAVRLQRARVRLAVPPRVLERRRLQGAADRLLRHHLPESLDGSRAAVRRVSRSVAAVAVDGGRAGRADAARRGQAAASRRWSPARSASTTCC